MLNTVKLTHTVWYDSREKILRLFMHDYIKSLPGNLDYTSVPDDIDIVKIHSITKTIMTFGDLPIDLFFGEMPKGSKLEDYIDIVYNETEQSIDIHLLPSEKFNNDGELVINLGFKIYNGKKSLYNESDNIRNNEQSFQLVIPIRSATKLVQNQDKFMLEDVKKLTLLNGTTMVPTGDDKVVYTFEVIQRDITDEFATYGDVKEMISTLASSSNNTTGTNSDVYTIELEGDLLVLTKENDRSFRRVIDLAKYHDEVTGQPVNVEAIKQDILDQVARERFIYKWMSNGVFTANDINNLLLDGPTEADGVTKTILNNYQIWQKHIKFVKKDDHYEIVFEEENMSPHTLLTIPFSSLRELPTATAGESITIEKILELVSDESKSEVISQIKSKLASTPLTAEKILDQATEAAADREKAGKLFQKLLDAETLNVVEKTDGYELSYTGDVNKVLVKIPKQAITVSQEVITAALTENVVTETIKPTLDKSYYSKEEVDNLIKKLKEELTAEDHDAHSAEEHPQQ